MKILAFIFAAAATILTNVGCAEVIFSDDFQDGNYSGWSISGSGPSATANLYGSNYSLRLRNQKTASQALSTVGYDQISVSASIAAWLLEGSDKCIAEVTTNGGSNWLEINAIANGLDDGVTLYSNQISNAALDNNANVAIRLRAAGNNNADYCYFDDITVTGTPDDPNPPSCGYDCPAGSGNTNRNVLTFNTLQTAGTGSLVDFSAFAMPAQAANPTNTFAGTLSFTGVVRGWQAVEDPYDYGAIAGVKQLPNFNYEFVQHGSHLIPVDRGLQITSHQLWELILEPGRVWNENNDQGYSRASIPFALQEYGANCTHNGVLTFLFKSDGSISNLAYQIASETCAYYQFNMYGRLAATYSPATIAGAAQLKADYEDEVDNRAPVKALAALQTDYPGSGINTGLIAGEQTPAYLSAFGVFYNGVHYVGGCQTRYGDYPYCEVMSLPSYSLSKSTFAGYGLMALEHSFPGVKQLNLGNYLPSQTCSGSTWGDVSFENALDMATGNYTNAGFEVDEDSDAMLNGFFLTYTDQGKTVFSCSYPRNSAPGSQWVYHSSDTYLLGKAMDTYLGQDSYTWILNNVFLPLQLSPVVKETVRTFDFASQPMAGFGLTFHSDDVIKLAEFLNTDQGKINGQQVLDLSMVNETLQQTAYHGLNAGSQYDWYDNGFWIWKADAALNCANDLYIPYMSGYGGISAVLLPNDMVYYFFSDNFEYTFTDTIEELNKIGNFCN